MAARGWLLLKLPKIFSKLPLSTRVIGNKSRYVISFKGTASNGYTKIPDLAGSSQTGGSFCGANSSSALTRVLFSSLSKQQQQGQVGCPEKSDCHAFGSSGHTRQIHGPGGSRPGQGKRKIQLSDLTEIIWPHPLKSMRNLFFSFLIRAYFDPSYSPQNFLKGAEQAVNYVSNMISQGKIDDLENLVTREALREIRQHYNEMNAKQRQWLAVDPKDIFFRFIYEIGMIFDDDTDQRFVEITTVFQGIHGFSESREKDPQVFKEELEHAQDQVYVCNYRFVREFTKGKEDDEWTINKLNHFSPKELVANSDLFRR